MNRTNSLVIALTLVASAACSKSESSSTADTTTGAPPSVASAQVSACSIASKEEMATAVGDVITATEEVNSNHCIFRTSAPLVYADVELDRENGAAAWEGINAGDSTIGAQQDSLAGIADKAFFGPRDRLYILRNGTFAAIEGGFDEKARSRAIAVAKLVASKL